MEIMIPADPTDFDFNSTRSTPYPSAPSSPRRLGHGHGNGQFFYTSAPTSPSRISEFYAEFDSFYVTNESNNSISLMSPSAIPFDWEEKPGTPKSKSKSKPPKANQEDFAFDLSAEMEKSSLTAEELFDGGKIRPLKPPPRLQRLDEYVTQRSPLLSPRSPRSPRSPLAQGKRIIREVFSPSSKKKADPFATAAENTRKRRENERGRQRRATDLSSSSRRATRSLSPYRVSEYPWEEEEEKQPQQPQQQQKTKQTSSSKQLPPQSSSKSSSRKWSLKDFLFRSASEGRATDGGLFRRNEDTRNGSSRSTESSGSRTGTGTGTAGSRRKGTISAHELHYTKNKAASEDLKKRTYLPYKQGILGRLAGNPASYSFGAFRRS